MQAEPWWDLQGSEGKGCQAAALAVAGASLEISGGVQSSTLRGSGGGRKMPGGCAGLCSEFPSQPSRGARQRRARGGMLGSARPRWDAAGSEWASPGVDGGGKGGDKRGGPAAGGCGEEAAAALKARYQWVSLQDKERPEPGGGGAVLGPSPGGPGTGTGTGTGFGPQRGHPGPRLRGPDLQGSQHRVLGRCGAARQPLLQSGFLVSSFAAFLDPAWSSSSAWAWAQRARLPARPRQMATIK